MNKRVQSVFGLKNIHHKPFIILIIILLNIAALFINNKMQHNPIRAKLFR